MYKRQVKRFGGHKVLIHYGGGSAVRSGLIDRVKASLEKEGLSYVVLGGVKPNPRSGLVYEGIELCRKEGVDFILAVGGGSTIDSSKAIAVGTVYDGDFWDFYSGKAQAEKSLPVGSVLTIAAAGSEGSDGSVITNENGMYKRAYGCELMRPVFAIDVYKRQLLWDALKRAGFTERQIELVQWGNAQRVIREALK